MKKLILLLGVLSCGNVLAQPVKEISSKADAGWYRETFSVLKTDKKVKHGPYKAYSESGKLLTTGFYKNGEKDSLWQEYNYMAKPIVIGNYKNGKPVGEWIYTDGKGEKENIFNFSTNELTFHKLTAADSVESVILQDGKQIVTKLERVPIFLPGKEIVGRAMLFSLRYPYYAYQRGVWGTVAVSFTVDEKGNVKDYYISRPVDRSLDNEALRCVKLIQGEWLPGLQNGKPVATVITQHVSFR